MKCAAQHRQALLGPGRLLQSQVSPDMSAGVARTGPELPPMSIAFTAKK
jgi:hypothetical protein